MLVTMFLGICRGWKSKWTGWEGRWKMRTWELNDTLIKV